MKFEDYLVAKREGIVKSSELARVARLKTIEAEIRASQRTNDWLQKHVSSVILLTTPEECIAVLARLKENGEVIGLDIETAKAADHPQAGLNPRVSQIRLVQLFQSTSSGVYIVDCFEAGYSWLPHLVGGHYAIHNASFECAHFWSHLPQELNIECTMLAGRVFFGSTLKLSELAEDQLDIKVSKALQVSDWSRPVLLEEQIIYAAFDAVAAKLLWHTFEVLFNASDSKYRNAYQFLRKLVYPVVRQAGILFDADAHAKVVREWNDEFQKVNAELRNLGLVNPASVKQKQAWLNQRLTVEDLLDWPQTDTGNLSTASDVLEQALHIPGAAPLARWSQLSTRLANFGSKVRQPDLYPACLI